MLLDNKLHIQKVLAHIYLKFSRFMLVGMKNIVINFIVTK